MEPEEFLMQLHSIIIVHVHICIGANRTKCSPVDGSEHPSVQKWRTFNATSVCLVNRGLESRSFIRAVTC